MTENMNSLCNAAAIRSLIEENKKIEEENWNSSFGRTL